MCNDLDKIFNYSENIFQVYLVLTSLLGFLLLYPLTSLIRKNLVTVYSLFTENKLWWNRRGCKCNYRKTFPSYPRRYRQSVFHRTPCVFIVSMRKRFFFHLANNNKIINISLRT